MTVRPPHRDELEALRAIELAAGRAFAGVGMPEIAADEPPSVEELEEFVAAGRAWVAVDDDGRPAAYLLAAVVDDGLHVEQVEPAQPGPDLAALVARERAAVPGDAPRVAMRRSP